MVLYIGSAAAVAEADATVDLLDGGTLVLYAGSVPTDPDSAPATEVATLTFGTPAFGAAADAGGQADATANAITSDTDATGGTVTHFRMLTSGSATVVQGTAGTSGTDMILDNDTIPSGATVSASSCVYTRPES